ncbi:MAG: tRNA (5-methylaminomethyl-2-thiouridylate)-methyltransferase, partial [bacterium]
VGRHFRISEEAKAIVGRDERENSFLENYEVSRCAFKVLDFEGPLTLIEGELSEEDRRKGAAITARYSDGKKQDVVRVKWWHGSESGVLDVLPIGDEIESLRI